MCTPKAQNYFAGTYNDDPGIGAADRLLRHCRNPYQTAKCAINGRKISDRAFAGRDISVDLECLLDQDGLAPDHRYGALPETVALLAVPTGALRAEGLGAAWTPKPKEPDAQHPAQQAANPYHGSIVGQPTPAMSRALVRASETVRCEFPLAQG